MKTLTRLSAAIILLTTTGYLTDIQAQAPNPQSVVGQDSLERKVITTAVPFLTITPDARAGGMADVGAATSEGV